MAVLASLSLVQPARADLTYSFTNAGHNVDLGTTHNFNPDSGSGGQLIASAFTDVSASTGGLALSRSIATHLFVKFTSGDPTETGLGTTADPSGQNEIAANTGNGGHPNGQAILLNFSNLAADHPYTLTLGSVQTGETFALYNASGNYITSSTTTGNNSVLSYTITTGTQFYVAAISGNVLLNTVVVTTTPEPATVAMAMTALPLLGLGALARRRRRARA